MSNRSIRTLEFGLNYTDLQEIYNDSEDQLHKPTFSGGVRYGSERKRLGYQIGVMFLNSTPSDISNYSDIKFLPLAKFILGRYDKVHLEVSIGDSFIYGIYRRITFEFGVNLVSANRYKNPQVLSYGVASNNMTDWYNASWYLEGDFTITDQLSVKPGIQFYQDSRGLQPTRDWDGYFCLSVAYRPKYHRRVAVSYLVD